MRRTIGRVALMLALSFVAAGVAWAASGPYGRPWTHGYFTGQQRASLDWVFVPFPAANFDGLGPNCDIRCHMTEAMFFTNYHDRLFDPNIIDAGRAAAEIDIMLGKQGPDFGNSITNGIAYAKAHYAEWQNLINVYAQGLVPGYSVNWNDYLNFTTIDTNGMGMTDVHTTDILKCLPQSTYKCIGDVAFFQGFHDTGFDYAVVFNANGKRFIIKHKCGNLTGDLGSLVIPHSTIKIAKYSNHPAPMPVGTTMRYSLNVNEVADIPLQAVTITDTLPNQFVYLSPATGTIPPTRVVGQTLTWRFHLPTDKAVLTTIADGLLTLSVNVRAVNIGTNIKNTATGTATDVFGDPTPVTPGSTLNTVVAEATPTVDGLNGDVQAGGGTCGAPPQAGFIQGYVGAGSYGQYAVSTSGTISGFGSNDSPTSSLLNLGRSGAYSSVCEADLYTAAMDGASQVASVTLPANSPGHPYNISGWSGIYYITGNAYLKTTGPIAHKLTIIIEGAAANIMTNMALTDHRYAAGQLPSVGLIARGDINIFAPVTLVDAYLFADGTIHTCLTGTGSCSTPTLVVHGFLMARRLDFGRLGPINALGNPLAEQIILNPQIYLNPPAFFDAKSVDRTLLIGQGERPPLY